MNSTRQAGDRPTDVEPVPEVLEWLVGAVVAIGGLALALGGSATFWASDERLIGEAIADGVADGSIRTDVLTPEQLTALVSELAFWVGIGLVVTGFCLVVLAVVYVIGRRRTRRATGPGNPREVLFAHAVLGAVGTWLLSFLPVSPVFGGGVAGYVHRRVGSATRVGAVSGLLATLPVVVIGSFAAVGLATGLDQGEIAGLGPIVALAVVVGILVALVYFVGLSALGGYIAAAIVDDDRPDETADDWTRDDEADEYRQDATSGGRDPSTDDDRDRRDASR